MNPLPTVGRHPLRLLLIWSPICLGMALLVESVTHMGWLEAALLTLPPMGLKLFLCLSIWPLCRQTPIESKGLARLALVHLVSASLMVGLWVFVASLHAEVLEAALGGSDWRNRFEQTVPLFLAVGYLLYFLSCLVHYLLTAVEQTRQAEREAMTQRLLASQAELASLRAIIHPHFLFNSLNALGALAETAPARVREMCAQLAGFLRYSMRQAELDTVTLADELEHVRNYLGVETHRLGSRLRTEYDIDPILEGVPVLPLSLLPLIENAVKHGVQSCLAGGTIRITARRGARNLLLEVSNPFDPNSAPAAGTGVGLANLRQRLATRYAGQARLVTHRAEDSFHATLSLPAPVEGGAA